MCYAGAIQTYPLAIRGAWRQFLLGDNVTFVQSNKETSTWLLRSHFPVPKSTNNNKNPNSKIKTKNSGQDLKQEIKNKS